MDENLNQRKVSHLKANRYYKHKPGAPQPKNDVMDDPEAFFSPKRAIEKQLDSNRLPLSTIICRKLVEKAVGSIMQNMWKTCAENCNLGFSTIS